MPASAAFTPRYHVYNCCIFTASFEPPHISFYNYPSSFSPSYTCLSCHLDIFPSCSIIVQHWHLLSLYKCTLQEKMWKIMNVYNFSLLCTCNSPLHLSQLSFTLFWKAVGQCHLYSAGHRMFTHWWFISMFLLPTGPDHQSHLHTLFIWKCGVHFSFPYVLDICSSSSFDLITVIFITTENYSHL